MFVDPKQLPLTSDASKLHNLRVFLLMQDWKGGNGLHPFEWEWESLDNIFYPITTKKNAICYPVAIE